MEQTRKQTVLTRVVYLENEGNVQYKIRKSYFFQGPNHKVLMIIKLKRITKS